MQSISDPGKNDCPTTRSSSDRSRSGNESAGYRKHSGNKTGPRGRADPGTGGCSGQEPSTRSNGTDRVNPGDRSSGAREVATDGGFDLPTYGTCSCGGTHVLDPETIPEEDPDVANGMVEFPCDGEDCDWAASMSPPTFEIAVENSDHSMDELREMVESPEVAA